MPGSRRRGPVIGDPLELGCSCSCARRRQAGVTEGSQFTTDSHRRKTEEGNSTASLLLARAWRWGKCSLWLRLMSRSQERKWGRSGLITGAVAVVRLC